MHLVWFRRDLRTLDNTALVEATKSGQPVIALYIATPEQWQAHQHSPVQADLILRRLSELKQQLQSLNIPLYYSECPDYQSSVKEVYRIASELMRNDLPVTIHFNREYEVNEVGRDSALARLASQAHISVKSYHDRCQFSPGTVLTKQGEMFKVFTPYKRRWLEMYFQAGAQVQKPKPVEKAELQDIGCPLFDKNPVFTYPRKSSAAYPVSDDRIIGLLRGFCCEKIDAYHQIRDFPEMEGTSRLSPYLAIGALSVRQCLARVSLKQPFSEGASRWLDELIWREFYIHLSAAMPSLSRGKPFHSWGRSVLWQQNDSWFEAWKQGRTGFPIVDAAMRQLSQTGWMHNRLRMITASFLVKDLLVDWRWGEEWFMSQLIDGDYASNNGGWQWCASTGCDGQPYFRIFNPVTQGEKFDPGGQFVRSWIPELKEVPDKCIHKPWLWPNSTLINYPQPIVDHKIQREIALAMYKNAKG
ncbi:deoxyribodipyrimidine photo-lyase [Vibrio sp. JC009]|uniref:deoxyribodipyrimidine photo-lyase n=1 Tax=Vibrio sp. JC009 TaxID=2912314 RepID=UPI0023B01154|nr:deoxyribodipyrimidine photo-lyase [Vibrio sp. JC009]WED23588.1 deoxyribodipyrimidine photo-lyase [Vibrio sp. JC009]